MKSAVESFFFYFLFGFLLILLGGCSGSSEHTPHPDKPENRVFNKPPKPRTDYVGSQRCQSCHTEIHEQFHSHPMGQSAGLVSTASAIENYDSPPVRVKNQLSYIVQKDDGETVYHEERFHNPAELKGSTRNSDEEFIYRHPEPVTYYIGSGSRGRSYLIQKQNDFYESPLTWYSQRQQWNLSPGYEVRNRHFERHISSNCLSCHIGRLSEDNTPPKLETANASQPLILEATISCERCHGPAADHVAWHEKTNPEGQDPILRLSELSAPQFESICYQCHLNGKERILRYGRSPFDFRPGDQFEDIWVCFVSGTGTDGNATRAVSQVEQMHSSKCYQKSNGGLNCVSCHDPHSIPSDQERISFYKNACLKCHGDQSTDCSMSQSERLVISSKDSCIDCHMPQVDASDVPHTAQTDHRILKAVDIADESKADSGFEIFRNHSSSVPRIAKERAQALLMAILAEREQNQLLAATAFKKMEKLEASFPDDEVLLVHLGIVARIIEKDYNAEEYFKKTLHTNPDNHDALLQLGMLSHDQNRPQKGIEFLSRYLQKLPHDREAIGRMIHMLGQTGQTDEAIQMAEKAIEEFPHAWRIRGWLIDAYRSHGRADEADKLEAINQAIRQDKN